MMILRAGLGGIARLDVGHSLMLGRASSGFCPPDLSVSHEHLRLQLLSARPL